MTENERELLVLVAEVFASPFFAHIDVHQKLAIRRALERVKEDEARLLELVGVCDELKEKS